MQLLGDFPLYKPYTVPVCDLEVPAVTQKDWVRLPCLLCIKPNQPRGRFDWLKHKIPTSMAIFHAEGWKPTAVLVHNTYLYLQSVEHLYLYTFHLCVAPYLLTPGCVSYLCRKICLLCILAIIIFIFFPAHLLEGRSREIGDKETHWEGYTIKLFKDMLWQFCIYFYDLLSHVFLKISHILVYF